MSHRETVTKRASFNTVRGKQVQLNLQLQQWLTPNTEIGADPGLRNGGGGGGNHER